MKLSVVMTAYNEEEYLPKALKSVFSQGFPKRDYEVIVVDNNSIDKSAEIARSFGAKVINETTQGYVFALAKGMRESTGEVIAATDSDTIVASDWLSEIAKTFEDKGVVAATGMADMRNLGFLTKTVSFLAFYIFVKFNFLIGKPHLSGFNFAVRRDVLEKAGGINTKYLMSPDVEIGLRLKKYGKVVFNTKILAHTSSRRWKQGYLSTTIMYLKGYFWTVWFGKPPPVYQEPVR
ncbi:MAG: glycosyltransferase family 2 protein [Candidatus Levybacteria bacterium]|nr:glycosyltransferase family 2 protein [Candidatus Levybacteria bacterium]